MEQHCFWVTKVNLGIWTIYTILAAMLIGASSSPYAAIFFLVTVALRLRVKVGVFYLSWFFMTLVIVYLGGIIVIFVYLRRLVQSIKINLLRTQAPFLLGITLLIISSSWTLGVGSSHKRAWVETGYLCSRRGLLLFIVAYLLGALLRVYRLCEKHEGPIKRG